MGDPLTELLQQGVKQLIQQAIEAELTELMNRYVEVRDDQDRRAVVRNGYLPERKILTGIGPVPVKVPKVRSRTKAPVVFRSSLAPPYVRKAKRVEAALPWLYLKGISTGKMEEALEALLGLKKRGLKVSPKLAVGDGALGFWAALDEIYPQTRHQRCWVHKTANVLNYLPRSVQPKAKKGLQEIWMAEDRAQAARAFDHVVQTYEAKYPKAVNCLVKDGEDLLAFHDFPAEHWVHIRTTNPIESTFATIRHRSDQARGCVSRKTMLAMIYKLGMSAEKRWRKIRGFGYLAKVIEGVNFQDGVEVTNETEASRSVA
ncbi:MAG TPA: hypothetical protein EYP40_07585 [Chromatiales bacterium]|nr:hypothetical protein [Chromatiales bacterium]